MVKIKKPAQQRDEVIESARQIIEYNQIARKYLGKIMENGQRFSTNELALGFISIMPEDGTRGYIIVDSSDDYKEKAKVMSIRVFEDRDIVREFVDNDAHLAGFSWRKI